MSCNWHTVWSESHIHTTMPNKQYKRLTGQTVTVKCPQISGLFFDTLTAIQFFLNFLSQAKLRHTAKYECHLTMLSIAKNTKHK